MNEVVQNMNATNPTDIPSNNGNKENQDKECMQGNDDNGGIRKENVQTDSDEDLYDDSSPPGNSTSKGENNDSEGDLKTGQGGYNETTMNQHNYIDQVSNEEKDTTDLRRISNGITTSGTNGQEDDPGFV